MIYIEGVDKICGALVSQSWELHFISLKRSTEPSWGKGNSMKKTQYGNSGKEGPY